ncbi:MAG: TrkA family potassium uptake protein [Clostridia bacterium]|nr:TrkA family potassium uptake protein [Clostridia bacterium]
MKKKNILVVGLKTFGMSIVKQLAQYNCEVLAIDKEMEKVEEADEYATHAIQVDIRNAEDIAELSLNTFDIAIITLDDIEASIMASLIFKEHGIETVIVKAKNSIHKRILQKMDVDKIISPDEEMGKKLAKSIMNVSVIDVINFSDDYSILEINAPEKWVGKSFAILNLRNEYGMNVLCVKHPAKEIEISPDPDYMIEKGDILVAIVENSKIEETDLK